METAYEFDSLTELPPLPQEYVPMEYFPSVIIPPPLESLAPFPPSDLAPFSDINKDLLHLQQQNGVADSLFLNSVSHLSLLNRYNNLTESTQFENLSDNDNKEGCGVDADSFFLDSLTHHHLTESNRLDNLFHSDVSSTPFLHLPDLKSIEQTTAVETKKPFLSPPSLVKTISPFSSNHSGSPATFGGDRRKKLSDKIRSLEKLMPWEKKMDMATILEEAYKYIKFLQSQIAALRWMPLESVYYTAGEPGGETEIDLLKSLTRQQILQVIANSPGARTVLYTRGVCIFSYEQLLSHKMMAQSARDL